MIRADALQAKPRSPATGRQSAFGWVWRTAFPAILGLALAACAAEGDVGVRLAGVAPPRPTPAPHGPPHFAGSEFITADDVHLPLRRWLPKGRVQAVILALHGFGDYSRAFAMPAALWATRDIATYAYDQRGFGGAPRPGIWPGEAQLTVDAIVAGRILRALYPDVPLYLLGESMGGAVAILAASGAAHGILPGPDGPPRAGIDGVVLSAPAVWGRATMDFVARLALFASVRLFPDMVLTGSSLHVLASDNLPMLRALARDPLVLKGVRIATIYGLVNLMDDALAAAPHLAAPTLLLYGARDEIVPRAAMMDFAAHLPPDRLRRDRLAYYPHGYHLLLRDLDRATVAGDVASWIFDRASPLPSRADANQGVMPWPPLPPTVARRVIPLASAEARR